MCQPSRAGATPSWGRSGATCVPSPACAPPWQVLCSPGIQAVLKAKDGRLLRVPTPTSVTAVLCTHPDSNTLHRRHAEETVRNTRAQTPLNPLSARRHPEKPPFEFVDPAVPHDRGVLDLTYHVGQAFVDLARLSPHSVSPKRQAELSIYAYPRTFAAAEGARFEGYPDTIYFIDRFDDA